MKSKNISAGEQETQTPWLKQKVQKLAYKISEKATITSLKHRVDISKLPVIRKNTLSETKVKQGRQKLNKVDKLPTIIGAASLRIRADRPSGPVAFVTTSEFKPSRTAAIATGTK